MRERRHQAKLTWDLIARIKDRTHLPVIVKGIATPEDAKLALEHGADVDALDDEYHGTPLAWAAAKGHEDTVKMLLDHGANPNLPVDFPKAMPLTRARASGHEGVVRLLEECETL